MGEICYARDPIDLQDLNADHRRYLKGRLWGAIKAGQRAVDAAGRGRILIAGHHNSSKS